MHWIKDNTGRFPRRPHYQPEELDFECERTISTFLSDRHGKIQYPISTDELTVLVESEVEDLDLYADFSSEEGEIEGLTNFSRGRRPSVAISASLSNTPNLENRLRTTLTHELGHVTFHAKLFDAPTAGSLFDDHEHSETNKCMRENMVASPSRDWMEWQAGYACGAFLMPHTTLQQVVLDFLKSQNLIGSGLSVQSKPGRRLISAVACAFLVSQDASRVRLLQQRMLVEGNGKHVGALFS